MTVYLDLPKPSIASCARATSRSRLSPRSAIGGCKGMLTVLVAPCADVIVSVSFSVLTEVSVAVRASEDGSRAKNNA